MSEINEALEWREKTTRLKNNLKEFLAGKKITVGEIAEFVRNASGSVLRIERFSNPFKNSGMEATFDELYHYIQLSLTYGSALVMVPLQVSLLESNRLNTDELIEYLHECVMLVKNIEDHTKEFPGVAGENVTEEIEEQFNDLLDEIEELAENGEYVQAIIKVDKAFEFADKEPFLFCDRVTMINNRAYYNCQLGNFADALKDVNQAINEDPEDDLPYYTKSEILVAINKLEEALDCITRSIEIEDSGDKQEYRKMILERL